MMKFQKLKTTMNMVLNKRILDFNFGAVAQLGERYNGIVEVVGSIPSGSTKIRY